MEPREDNGKAYGSIFYHLQCLAYTTVQHFSHAPCKMQAASGYFRLILTVEGKQKSSLYFSNTLISCMVLPEANAVFESPADALVGASQTRV